MAKTLRFLTVVLVIVAVLTGAPVIAQADPTPCPFGCDGP